MSHSDGFQHEEVNPEDWSNLKYEGCIGVMWIYVCVAFLATPHQSDNDLKSASLTRPKITEHLYLYLYLYLWTGLCTAHRAFAALTSARTRSVASWSSCLPFTSVHILLGSSPKRCAALRWPCSSQTSWSTVWGIFPHPWVFCPAVTGKQF